FFVLSFKFLPLGITFPLCYVLRPLSSSLERAWFRSFLHCIETSGPTFIKFMQWVSTRPDLFP
ncbi:unnamed protein product, partial [Heterosigma akashiwo]